MKLQSLLYNALQEAKDPMDECDGCERDGVDWTHGHDHEASMADSELRDMISNASKLQNIIQPGDELPGWVSAYISLAADYMHSVAEYMEGKQAEMGADAQAMTAATPGFAIYEDQTGKPNNLPVKYSKGGFPNFFIAKIRYSGGSGGVLSVGGQTTATGQQRKENAQIALKQGKNILEKVKVLVAQGDKKRKLDDSTVEDLGNGTVEVFAVSDYFNNIKESDYEKLINS